MSNFGEKKTHPLLLELRDIQLGIVLFGILASFLRLTKPYKTYFMALVRILMHLQKIIQKVIVTIWWAQNSSMSKMLKNGRIGTIFRQLTL